ncbi:cytochrome b [Duganella qianjiadongensis]|uniref:Cytochrome b n=1 Tax=Duganella qianjiadongensis TaxID=2692176 RepID=A0ABW9VPT5_9BURK|nr:cytochrome b [Duganella qianjiadongensis]MYM40449.1 cytochrome b [Duganella qianjiadongensis]
MQRYTKTAIALHWLIALLIIAAFCLGVTMVDIPGFTPTKLKYFSWHKWLGVTVLGLAAIRLLWRLSNKPPAALPMPRWQHVAAEGMHHLLYLLMFAVPVSGYLYSYAAGVPVVYLGLFQMPAVIGPDPALKPVLKTVHYVLTMTMAGAVAAHALAAIKHHLIDRDATLKRMLP